jgi:S-adenosylmethionine-diacylglycerol 3-amino-3-carboxypropyl transferase
VGFFETLNYSSVNEDWRSEAAALQLSDGDRVICVTGSGARPLDLLAAAEVPIVAIDASTPQNHLLRLKMAAILGLEFPDYARFLGLDQAPTRWRRSVLAGLLLSDEARAYWGEQRRMVDRGVIYEGRFERHFRRLSFLARVLRPRAIRELLAFEDLEAQRRFVEARWDTVAWRAVYSFVTHPLISRMFFGDPGYYEHTQLRPGRTIFERMNRGLTHWLARDSFMVHLVLTGRLSPRDLPPHLTAEGVRRIRPRLERVEVVDAELGEWLASAGRTFDRFSLSDVPSYMDEGSVAELVQNVDRAAAPGARVAIRQFLTNYSVRMPSGWVREPRLERRLAAEGRDFAYEFVIARVTR